jgi:hypothetical protein
MAAVFYVILRFKLEKYASDYREKRLKREMDEIIVEFNETAERNISLLENRLELLKKFLEQSNKINNIDLSADEKIQIKNTYVVPNDVDLISDELRSAKNDSIKEPFDRISKSNSVESGLISRYFSKIKLNLEKTYKTIVTNKNTGHELYREEKISLNQEMNFDDMIKIQSGIITSPGRAVQENDEENLEKTGEIVIGVENNSLSEDELEEMFSISDDKYFLISDLFNKGYTSDVISRCSGIPIGEIKLVLDLNNTL